MKTNSEGYMIPPGEGIIGVKPHCMFSNYQLDIYETAIEKCKQKRRALDLGANVGVMSIRMMNHFEDVESFEPIFHEYIELNTKSGVNVYPHALGAKEETLTMRVGRYNSGMSNIVLDKKRDKQQLYQKVEVKTLDSFNFENVDLLKLDVEEYEWQVIQGAKKTIESNLPVIMVEIHRDYKYARLVFDYLKSLGYNKIHCKKVQDIGGTLQTVNKSDYVFWRD